MEGSSSSAPTEQRRLEVREFPREELHPDHQRTMDMFWRSRQEEIETMPDVRSHVLPVARLKRVIRAEESDMMIAADTPAILTMACELFVMDLTMHSWMRADAHRRRILQDSDVNEAISCTDSFDFLLDILLKNRRERDRLTAATPNSNTSGRAGASTGSGGRARARNKSRSRRTTARQMQAPQAWMMQPPRPPLVNPVSLNMITIPFPLQSNSILQDLTFTGLIPSAIDSSQLQLAPVPVTGALATAPIYYMSTVVTTTAPPIAAATAISTDHDQQAMGLGGAAGDHDLSSLALPEPTNTNTNNVVVDPSGSNTNLANTPLAQAQPSMENNAGNGEHQQQQQTDDALADIADLDMEQFLMDYDADLDAEYFLDYDLANYAEQVFMDSLIQQILMEDEPVFLHDVSDLPAIDNNIPLQEEMFPEPPAENQEPAADDD